MNRKTYTTSILATVIALLSLGLVHPGYATAEQMPETEAQVLREGAHYTGTINSINSEQALVIIDDRSFVLDRVIRFNNASWSREQVLNRLVPGNRVEIEVGRIIDSSRGARLIVSLRTFDR